ncbi:MAG: hypothetical protein QOJ92_2403 [Frankiales bacterium]|nr:hypothetical protein [Frankiales bacterium]
MRSSAAVRLTLGAALVGAALVPAFANAALTDCNEASFDGALCVAKEIGTTAQTVESPLVGPRDQARTAGETALEAAGLCDPYDKAHCLLPFPSDTFTKGDATSPTGLRINLSPLAMPRNVAGKPIDPTEWNRNDGWSPGTPLYTSVAGIDLAKTGAAGLTDIGASLAPDAPIVLIDAATGQRAPYWAELDGNPTDGEQPLLIVRPAVNFTEGHRYVVGMRHLRDSANHEIQPGDAWRARRDPIARAAIPVNGSVSGKNRDKILADPILGPLWANGYRIDDLYLAWTFTIASVQNNTARMLHMRDDAFASLGGGAPKFSVTSNTANPDTGIARRVQGTFTVPNYLNVPANKAVALPQVGTVDVGLPGTRLLYLPGDDLPDRNGDFTATFTCNIPASVVSDPVTGTPTPGHGVIYGHGLLGSQGEVNSGPQRKMAVEHQAVYCATDWYGMATGDVPNVATMLADMSNFPTLADRVQEGMLAQLFLARLLKDPRGFDSDPAFQQGGVGLVHPNDVSYDGNSQGGIIGGAIMGIAQDITRGVLGVPATNYSTLLDRSSDFSTYEGAFNAAYPSEVDREIAFGLIQMLWDRAEGNGYAAHIQNDPLPGTPSHRVLMHLAFGDHQVSNAAAEVEARTIGAQTNSGFLAPGRHWAVEPGWAIPRVASYPFDGSAMVYWDSGSPQTPLNNTPPSAGRDPHSDPRSTLAARDQKAEFLWGSGFIDVCGGAPCLARPLAPE